MAVLLKCGAIFLHIPKTGGSWVTKVLEEQGLVKRHIGHIHADTERVLRYKTVGKVLFYESQNYIKSFVDSHSKRKIRQMYNSFFDPKRNEMEWPNQSDQIDNTPYMFCFVRHPLSWYESYWRYMNKHRWPLLGSVYDIHNWHPLSILNGLGNDDFNSFMRNVLVTSPGFVSQMYNSYTTPVVNFVGKQENLVDDLINVLQQLDLRFDADKIRATHPVNVMRSNEGIEWDSSLYDRILHLECAAIHRFDYV